MADIWYCPNHRCPYAVEEEEAYYTEFPGECPYCGTELVEEKGGVDPLFSGWERRNP